MSDGATLSVVVLVPRPEPEHADDEVEIVRYCDVCRRWGSKGSTHICGENWSEHLKPILLAGVAA